MSRVPRWRSSAVVSLDMDGDCTASLFVLTEVTGTAATHVEQGRLDGGWPELISEISTLLTADLQRLTMPTVLS